VKIESIVWGKGMRFIKGLYSSLKEISNHVFLFLTTAVAGATISYGVNLLFDWSGNTSSLNIDGRWMSVSCDRSSKDSSFVAFDIVNIDVSFLRGIRISNVANTKLNSYSYVGSGKVIEGRFFFGEWRSIKTGANTKGAFSFVISPQGDSLVGTFTGFDDFGSYTQCWIMGRNVPALQRGYELSQSQIKVPVNGTLGIPAELLKTYKNVQ
jgi:hypothetical protein